MVFVPDNYALSLNKSCLLYLLLKRVRSILLSGRPSSYILLTASSTTAENYNLATEAGIDDFLSKPVHRSTIRMRLAVAERILKYTAEIRQLRELIPICMYCHKVRDEQNYWERVETYIQKETGSRFSHGACPECYEKQIDQLRAATARQ